MNRAIKSLNLLAVIILIAAILGCDNDGGGQGDTVPLTEVTVALTENDFANDQSLRADPEKNLIVTFVEHQDSDKPENDTGEAGNDIIPYTYTRTLENTFCWEDEDGEAGHFMELDDSDGNEIFRLDANGECITVVLEAGDYLMHIHHDGRAETTHPIFIIPDPNGDLGAKKEETIPEGILERAGRVFSKILEKLDIGITQTTSAQTSAIEGMVRTLLSTNSCVGCTLRFSDLRFHSLNGANMFQTDLFGANMSASSFNDANISRSDLREAMLVSSFLNRANLSFSELENTNLRFANLIGANLTRVKLGDGWILQNTNFSGATWIDGCTICGENSFVSSP